MKYAAIAAVALAAAGCGGHGDVSHAARFHDAYPCLRRLAIVGSRDPHVQTLPTQVVTTVSSKSAGVMVPEWIADLAFRGVEARVGAGSAFLRFYQNAADAEAAAGGGATVIGKTVVVWWSHAPTRRQERRLESCLSSGQ